MAVTRHKRVGSTNEVVEGPASAAKKRRNASSSGGSVCVTTENEGFEAKKPNAAKKTKGKQALIVCSSSKAESAKKSKRSGGNITSASTQTTQEAIEEVEEVIEEVKELPITSPEPARSPKSKRSGKSKGSSCRFLGKPLPKAEAREKWPHRYDKAQNDGEDEFIPALHHYAEAEVDGVNYSLNDDVYVQGEPKKPDYIARIVEFFESTDKSPYFTAQWYYRDVDTVIQERVVEELQNIFDKRRVFISDIKDPNPLDCIVSKLKILRVAPNIKLPELPPFDYYCDMRYSLDHSTFSYLPADCTQEVNESSSTVSSEGSCGAASGAVKCDFEESSAQKTDKLNMKLLDLYSGCGGMSTGLCLGAAMSGVNLVTRWAVDMNPYACESLRHNHPETEVRNESADNFLILLKKWAELCGEFCSGDQNSATLSDEQENEDESDSEDDEKVNNDHTKATEIFEVEKLLDICFGNPNETNKKGLYFKVRWKGYGPDEDTWEPVENLSDCQKKIREFVLEGYKSNILPLPGDADIVCGGPPCQGVSGFNRFRNTENPLKDARNSQLIVFMDIVEYLKPKYVLMENVTDILKFVGGYLGRYAIGRLVAMKYQSRLGLMVAGSYGLPQFRMRAFFWGACPSVKLPQFPLPTYDVAKRGNVPCNFESSLVAHKEGHSYRLGAALQLKDAISDLPPVKNDENRDEMEYSKPPQTEFQKRIRLPKQSSPAMLYDHRPLNLNQDDYDRVCRIPKEKGANFRMLPGVLVGPDNKVYWDPKVEREFLPSGNPLVPDYAMTFVKGKSKKPFARLWWDEIVPTVVTRAEPHNQRILHPLQDRVLTIRENARLQGFPDHYKLSGPVKERYIQVGNAVAVPVASALGYALGLALHGATSDEPVACLPSNFPISLQDMP